MNFIWKMKVDGLGKERIAYDATSGEIRMPNWSSDNKIVHQRYIVGIGGAPEIFTMNSSGKNVVRLTYDKNFDSYPKYSPDRITIAFTSQPNGGSPQIWVMNSDGTNLKQLTPRDILFKSKPIEIIKEAWVQNQVL